MGNTENHRRKLALLLSVIIFVLTLFITVVGNNINDFYHRLSDIEDYAQEQKEEYLQSTLAINNSFLETVKSDWQSYKEFVIHTNLDEESYIQDFADRFLVSIANTAYMSVIVTTEGNEFVTVLHNYEVYKNINYDFSNIPADGSVTILNGDPEKPFGTGDRFYTAGKELKCEGVEFSVYIGYSEKIMHENFINALNVDSVDEIKSNINYIIYSLIALLLFIIFYGIYLIYFIRKLKIVVYQDMVDEIDEFNGFNKKNKNL